MSKLNAAIALCGVFGLSASVLAQGPAREGSGSRRDRLDQMELKPFPSDAWSHLSDWTGGEVSASTASGQVVLICTWANWNPLCKSAVSTAKRMADQHGGDGLIVVGAHDRRRWDDAAKKAGEGMILAVDEEGAFREALLVDQDPDFYLIDRAGNLRYADIETGSVAEATRQLVGETRESAADYPARLEREAARAAAEARRTGQIQSELDLSELPDVSFVPPQAEAYTQANWPNRAREFEEDVLQIRNRGFGSEEAPSVTIAQPPADPTQMFGRKPRSPLGRVTVVYFWTPDFYPSWARIQPQMNQLQREKWRDVNVYGVLTRFATRNNSGNFNNQSQEEVEQARKRFENLVTKAKARRDYDHTIFADADDALLGSVLANNSGRGFENRFLPLVAVFSSDNQMRWIGTPLDSRFQTALSQVLRVDPGVQARRIAEDKWIRENK